MLKLMRDSFQHLKWVLVFIIFLFVMLVFVDWGGAGRTGGATGDLGAAAARVNGDTITFGEYRRALYYAEQRFEQIYGQKLTEEMRKSLRLEEQVLNDLVNQNILLQQAAEMNLVATEDEVRKAILETPVLNPDGNFVGSELYERYILGLGYQSVADYEREVARELTLQKMQSALATSVAIPPTEAEKEYRKQTENAGIRFVYYPSSSVEGPVEVSPADVEAFYDSHSNRYSHAEQRRVRYLIADVARVRAGVTLDDGELESYYEVNKESYRGGESVRASHILLPLAPDANPQAVELATARAAAIVTDIRGGADFAELARINSADPGSSAQGGDVGFFDRGAMVPEFEEAAFSLSIGEISEPVRTQFGLHILKVTEKREAGYRPLSEVRSELTTKLIDEKATNMARDAVASARARVERENVTDEAGLRTIADSMENVALNDTQWFERNDSIFGLGQSEDLAGWAFAANQGELSAVITTPRGPLVGWLEGSRPAGISDLSEVRALVEADVRKAKTAEAAKLRLEESLPVDSLETLAAKFDVEVQQATVNRGGSVPGLTGDVEPVIDAAFAGTIGEFAGPVATDQGAVLLLIESQKKFDPEVYAAEKDRFVETMRRNEAGRLIASMLEKLRAKSNIVLNSQIAGTTPGV